MLFEIFLYILVRCRLHIFSYYISINKIMTTRNREFNETRNKNLAKSSINLSTFSHNNGQPYHQNTANNQSFTSSFLKKAKPDVCVTCVNKKIVNQKKTNETNEKMKEMERLRAQLQYQNAQRDKAKEYREKMKKQAAEYNKSLISSHKNINKQERLLDNRYMDQLISKQQKELLQDRERLQKQKQQLVKYRKELYLQYKSEEQKKKQQKAEKLKPQTNQLNLKQIDRSKMIKEYSTEIKKQINNNNLKKIIQKEVQTKEQRKILQLSERQFLKYTQFVNQSNNNASLTMNPEVFQELKLIDYTKRIRKIEERQMKNKQRQEMLQKERQLYQSETERSLRQKKEYERELKQQMTQKCLKTAAEREEELQFQWKEQKYTQDIIKQSRIIKPCEQCLHKYDQKCLI